MSLHPTFGSCSLPRCVSGSRQQQQLLPSTALKLHGAGQQPRRAYGSPYSLKQNKVTELRSLLRQAATSGASVAEEAVLSKSSRCECSQGSCNAVVGTGVLSPKACSLLKMPSKKVCSAHRERLSCSPLDFTQFLQALHHAAGISCPVHTASMPATCTF
jgi:hypothetical protein